MITFALVIFSVFALSALQQKQPCSPYVAAIIGCLIGEFVLR